MPSDRETIRAFLQSDVWTESEKWVIKWQFDRSLGLLGDFGAALARAITLADIHNLERLHEGFPAQVEGYLAWTRGDLGTRLRGAGLNI